MEKINFEDGQLVTPASVNIEGTQYLVTEAEYTGQTPLSAFVLNKMQGNIENAIQEIVDTYDADGDGIVDNAKKVNGHTVGKDVPASAKFTDTTYTVATTTQDGLMSKEDKATLGALKNIEAIKKAINGVVVFEGMANEEITLSETLSDASKIEIFYIASNKNASVCVFNPVR